MPSQKFYDRDFFKWTEQQGQALRRSAQERVNSPLDWENLAEEIESLGRRDRREAASLVQNIIEHLIKLKVSPAAPPRAGWKAEVDEFRARLAVILDESPSLRPGMMKWMESGWPRAMRLAAANFEKFGELDAVKGNLAELREGAFSLDEIMREGVYPDPPSPDPGSTTARAKTNPR